MTRLLLFLAAICALALPSVASAERVRDIGQFQSVRSNQLTGYGIVVGLDGVEKNVNWLRQDDGSRPGYADIAAHHEVMVGAGDACSFLPDDIHSVENDGDKPTLSLHLYGAVLANNERSEFDPEAKVQRPCPKRVRKAAN